MPTPVIDNTVGGTAANSYVTVADADQYAAERIPAPAAYNAASATDKTAALIMACRRLQQEEFDGVPVTPFAANGTAGQALHWPRWGCIDLNGFPIGQVLGGVGQRHHDLIERAGPREQVEALEHEPNLLVADHRPLIR